MDRLSAGPVMRRSGWLARQPEAFRTAVLAAATLRRFERDETVRAFGDPADAVWGIVEGELAVLVAPPGAAPVIARLGRPGQWVGDAAMPAGTECRTALVGRQGGQLLRVSLSAIEALAARDPETWRRVGELVVEQLDHFTALVAGLTLGDSQARIAAVLARLAEDGGASGDGPAALSLSLGEIGEITRLNRNAVGTVLDALAAQGLVLRTYRSIGIPSVAALLRHAERRLG